MEMISKLVEAIQKFIDFITAIVAYVRKRNDGDDTAEMPEFVL